MSTYRRSKFTFGDYGASSSSTYHSGPLTSSAAGLTRTYNAPPIQSLVNGSASGIGIVASSAAAILTSSAAGRSRYVSASSYSSPKLTSSTYSTRTLPSSSVTTSTFSTRSPRLQSYLSARDMDTKASSKSSGYLSSTTWRSRPEVSSNALTSDLSSSRSRSYSHSYSSNRHDDSLYRGRSTSSIRDTSPYDSERDRDLVMTMRSQSAMSSRGPSRDLSRDRMGGGGSGVVVGDRGPTGSDRLISSSYTSGSAFMDDPLLASTSYARQLTTDMNSLTGMGSSAAAPAKKYGSDDSWNETNWLNNLRVSAGMDPIPMPSSNVSKSLAYEAISTLPRMARSNSSHDLRDLEMTARGIVPASGGGKGGRPEGRARHQTLAYGVSASDLGGSRGNLNPAAFTEISGYTNGSDADFLVARVPSREGEVYDVRGFESDMSAAIMNARSRRHSLDNEIVELHPPLVTFASVEYDGDPPPPVHNPPPPAPYDHKNLVVVNKNDLESILVKGAYNATATPMSAAKKAVPNTTDNSHTNRDTASSIAPPIDNRNNNNPSSVALAAANRSGSTDRDRDRSQNGEIDYKRLWEKAQLDNSKLNDELSRTRDELSAAKKKLDSVVQSPQPSSGLTDTEKKEKQALEKKLAEMEEELKLLALSENLTDQQLEHLKNDNQRLRDENGALIRVISKLSK